MHTILWIAGIYLAIGIVFQIVATITGGGGEYRGKLSWVIRQYLKDIFSFPIVFIVIIPLILLTHWFLSTRGGGEQWDDTE